MRGRVQSNQNTTCYTHICYTLAWGAMVLTRGIKSSGMGLVFQNHKVIITMSKESRLDGGLDFCRLDLVVMKGYELAEDDDDEEEEGGRKLCDSMVLVFILLMISPSASGAYRGILSLFNCCLSDLVSKSETCLPP
jgi:hypothetical protein